MADMTDKQFYELVVRYQEKYKPSEAYAALLKEQYTNATPELKTKLHSALEEACKDHKCDLDLGAFVELGQSLQKFSTGLGRLFEAHKELHKIVKTAKEVVDKAAEKAAIAEAEGLDKKDIN